MKPGPSGSALADTPHPLRDMYDSLHRGFMIHVGRHELALRIRAHFGYDWLMLYKRERRKAARGRDGL